MNRMPVQPNPMIRFIRKLFGTMSGPAQSQYAPISANVAPWTIGKPEWPTWDPAIAARDGYEKLAVIFRCINLIAHAAGTARVKVYDDLTEEEQAAHPMRALMKRPNPQMGEAIFHGTVAMRSAISGFCVVEKERNRLGEVISLWPMRSAYLTAIPRRNSAPDWEYRIPGRSEKFTLKAEDVIVHRWADTASGSAYGIGALEACLRESAVSTTMTDFLKAFFDHGAVPLVGLIPDLMPGQTMTQARSDRLLEQFMDRHGGLDKAHLPAVLQGVKEIVKLGFDFNELAYVDLRDLSELGIAQAFGIPASVIPLRVGLEHSDSRANAESDEGKFYRQAIVPFWTRWDDTLTLGLLEEFDDSDRLNLAFDYSDVQAMQEDRNAKAAWTVPAVTQGVMSVHSWHREMGLPLPKGDDFFIRSFAQVIVPADDPLGIALPEPEPEAEAEPEPEALPPGEAENSARMLPPGATLVGIGPEARFAAAGNDRSMMAKVAKAQQPAIRRFFIAQGKRIIPKIMDGILEAAAEIETYRRDSEALDKETRLSGLADVIQTYAVSDVDWDDETSRIRKVLAALHVQAGKESFRNIKKVYGIDPGISFDLANPNVKRVIDKLGSKIKEITIETKANVSAKVAAGLDQGLTSREIADQLTGMFEETYANRSWAIARTETTHAYGEANALGFKESGVVDRAQLFDNPEHEEDYGASDGLTCATRDGFVCPLDEMMDHIYADHPNGSVTGTPILIGEKVD